MSETRPYRRSEVPWLVLGALIGVVFVLPFMPIGRTEAQNIATILGTIATILGTVGCCALI
jgi:hypothetical protein